MPMKEFKTSDNLDSHLEQRAVYNIEARRDRESRIEWILKIYSIFGLLGALVLISLFILKSFDIVLGEEEKIYLASAVLFIIISVFSRMILVRRKQRSIMLFPDELMIFLFLKEWKRFEFNLDKYLEKNNYETRKGAINQKVASIEKLGVFDELDTMTINLILKIRNKIVHEANFENYQAIEHAIKSLENLNIKLEKY